MGGDAPATAGGQPSYGQIMQDVQRQRMWNTVGRVGAGLTQGSVNGNSFLESLGLGLSAGAQSDADPVRDALRMRQMRGLDQRDELNTLKIGEHKSRAKARKEVLDELAGNPSFGADGYEPPDALQGMTPEMQRLVQLNAKMDPQGTLGMLLRSRTKGTADQPMNVREWKYFNSLPEADRKRYLMMKRSNPPVNLGDRVVTQNPVDPGGAPLASLKKGLPPEQRPEVKGAQEAAKTEGKDKGDVKARLAAADASMPQLEAAVKKLSAIGKKATYTVGGQAKDYARRQAGLSPTEGSLARVSYESHVANNILPLLRQTFGAAFTAKEGESLKATLGDPDMHPKEKDAALAAFIENKRAQLETLRRQAGERSGNPEVDDLLKKYGKK